MSRLRRLVLSDRYFFVTCNVRRDRHDGVPLLVEREFAALATAINASRDILHFLLTGWVFIPDHWHAIIFPPYPLTISKTMKDIKARSTHLVNSDRRTAGSFGRHAFTSTPCGK